MLPVVHKLIVKLLSGSLTKGKLGLHEITTDIHTFARGLSNNDFIIAKMSGTTYTGTDLPTQTPNGYGWANNAIVFVRSNMIILFNPYKPIFARYINGAWNPWMDCAGSTIP